MTDLKKIDLNKVHSDYMKNIDQEQFWETELIHVHQKNNSFTTATVLKIKKNKKTEMTSVKVKFTDSGRTDYVDLRECRKLVLEGPRQLRRRSSENVEVSFPKVVAKKAKQVAKIDAVSDPRTSKKSTPSILKRKGDSVQNKPSKISVPRTTVPDSPNPSPFFTNKTTDFGTAVSQSFPDLNKNINKNEKPPKISKNKMNLAEYQTESTIKSVKKSMDQDEKIEKLLAENKKHKTKISRLEKDAKENKQATIAEIEEIQRHDETKSKSLSRAHEKEMREKEELWEIEKENYEKIQQDLKNSLVEKENELQDVRRSAMSDGEQLVISSLKGIQDRLKPARKRRKEIMKGTKPFEKEFFGENNTESYVTCTQEIEFGKADPDIKRELYLESLQNQNFIYNYVNESLAKCNESQNNGEK